MPSRDPLWSRAALEKVLPYVLVGGGLAVLAVILGEEIGHHLGVVEAWIEGLGPWGVVAFAALYGLLSALFVPDSLLGIVGGASFGFGPGLAAGVAGTLVGATLEYALARRILRGKVERYLGARPGLAAVQTAVRRQELRLQLLIRLTPLNRAVTSYVLGAAGVGFARFMVALVAVLPHLCLEVYFGYAGKRLALALGRSGGPRGLHEVALALGLVAAIVAVAMISRTARKAVEAAAEKARDEGGG